jgi:co-chaperonin GroES (HSP10)
MKLRPLGNTILFSFLDTTVGAKGRFTERTQGLIIIPVLDSAQHKTDRWGKVISVGPKVDGLEPGDFILIEALQWTPGTEFDDDKIWKTDDSKVIVATNDEASTYTTF